MVSPDSLVFDLIFERGAEIAPEALLEALGGEETIKDNFAMIDADRDPNIEMQLCPSMPFRHRDERRILIIDVATGPLREDPRAEPIVTIDLRDKKQFLVDVCKALPIRLGRMLALGAWGDAAVVTKTARDLRAINLLFWVLDPRVDVDGNKRTQLTQQEFELKIAAYEKRLDELDDQRILKNLRGGSLTKDGDYLIVDALDDNGHWDVRKSLEIETSLAAIKQFSHFPGAKQTGDAPEDDEPDTADNGGENNSAQQTKAVAPADEPPPEAASPPAQKAGPPLRVEELGERVILVFPKKRFNLDIAAALGTKNFEDVIGDELPGVTRDRVLRDGADFVTSVEFFSEVFLDGMPLSRPQFEQSSTAVGDRGDGAKTMRVHCPRYGEVSLLQVPDKGLFITSNDSPEAILPLL